MRGNAQPGKSARKETIGCRETAGETGMHEDIRADWASVAAKKVLGLREVRARGNLRTIVGVSVKPKQAPNDL